MNLPEVKTMNNVNTRNSVLRQLNALQKMTIHELKEKWRDIYGFDPPNLGNLFMLKRLAFRIQELYYGGLSKKASDKLQQCMQSVQTAKLGMASEAVSKKLLTGARFIREWHGERYEVVVRDDGFEYNGQIYRSLSAIAQKITGTKWNGLKFFRAPKNLTQKRG